ncbi:MAG TPA: Clp protease N-terminal domain-containing protein [Gemmatimonadaceae bacterium]|nr:Clp protease N-terminal domain-containing protein [Gemmatimonadaceae bacterium]
MEGYFFTNEVREILQQARLEAARLRHDHVGTQHLLLAFTAGNAAGNRILEEAGTTPATVRAGIHETAGDAQGLNVQDLPYTSRAKKALELAMKEARALQHGFVGAEHLLLGLIHADVVTAGTLTQFGIHEDDVRSALLTRHPRDPGLKPVTSALDFLKTPIRFIKRITPP